jgi:hypothetical protein
MRSWLNTAQAGVLGRVWYRLSSVTVSPMPVRPMSWNPAETAPFKARPLRSSMSGSHESIPPSCSYANNLLPSDSQRVPVAHFLSLVMASASNPSFIRIPARRLQRCFSGDRQLCPQYQPPSGVTSHTGRPERSLVRISTPGPPTSLHAAALFRRPYLLHTELRCTGTTLATEASYCGSCVTPYNGVRGFG